MTIAAAVPLDLAASSRPDTLRVSANPALTRVSRAALSQVLLFRDPDPPVNAPMTEPHTGSLYPDHTDTNLFWYVPAYSLTPDPDATFSFVAKQSGAVDLQGNPFCTGKLTFSLAKAAPADVQTFLAGNPDAYTQEIPFTALSATLTLTTKDGAGQDQLATFPGTCTPCGVGMALEFDNVLGPSVIALYRNLKVGGASVTLSGSYFVWQLAAASEASDTVPRHDPLPIYRTAVNPLAFSVNPLVANVATDEPGPVPPPPPPLAPTYRRIVCSTGVTLSFADKFTADTYLLMYTMTTGTSSHAITNVNDLRNFYTRHTEYVPLTVLGDFSQRYPSLSRAYFGVLSKTIILIPTRYSITRSLERLHTKCTALRDSGAATTSKCKFQFTFLIAPDVSPIDLLQLSEEISAVPALANATLRFPQFLDTRHDTTLQTIFKSSLSSEATDLPQTFALKVDIRDDGATPAVANANLLIQQLCSGNQPYLFGSIPIRLDDYYTETVTAPVVLNFHSTVSDPAEIALVIDEAAQVVHATNNSVFNLSISRSGLGVGTALTIATLNQVLAPGATVDIALPPDHTGLTVLLEREIASTGDIWKADIDPFLNFEIQDVQNTQMQIGVNAWTHLFS